MKPTTFDRFAGLCAVISSLSGLLYSISFIILQSGLLSATFLLLGGLLSMPALIALYRHLNTTEAGFALLGLLFSLSAALGSAIHGGYDLANAIHPTAAINPDLPNPIDPRGLLTFGVAGIGIYFLSWLVARNTDFPKRFAYLGYLSAILMVILYLGRLILLQAANPVIVVPALMEGFVVNPIWYFWLGLRLFRDK
jgi:hypothetical protein